MNGGTTWTTPTPTGITRHDLRRHFIDANNGWVVGRRRQVSHTTNGGTTWTAQTSGVTVTLYGVDASPTPTTAGRGPTGTDPKLTNGGTTWSQPDIAEHAGPADIIFAAGTLDVRQRRGRRPIWSTRLLRSRPLPACRPQQHGLATTSQSVTLTATDGQSGVKATYYTIDGGARDLHAPFTCLAAGTHTVVYWSVDVAGNTEAQHTGYVNIDTTAPVDHRHGPAGQQPFRLGHDQPERDADGHRRPVRGHHHLLHDRRGSQPLYTGPSLSAATAPHTVTYWSVDAAGNVEATTPAT